MSETTIKYVNMAMRGRQTTRFHTLGTIKQQNLADHSWGVAVFCDLLSGGQPSATLLKAAMYHDMPEQWTGDVPFTAKRDNSNMRVGCATVESKFYKRYRAIQMQYSLTEEETLILQWADALEGMHFCYAEMTMGNMMLYKVFWKWEHHLRSIEQHAVGVMLLDDIVTELNAGPTSCYLQSIGEE